MVRTVDIEIAEGRIRAVATPGRPNPPVADREIDATGLFAVPGYWDAHVHLAEDEPRPDALATLVGHGILGVRDAGSALESLAPWSRAIEARERVGPHLTFAGPTLNGPGDDSLHIEVVDGADAVAAVNRLADRGARWIKVHRLIGPDLLPVIAAETHRRGLRLFGHIPRGMSPLAACQAGMDGIEHVGSVLESIVSVRQGGASDIAGAVAQLDSPETDAFVRCLIDRDVSFTPTLAVYRHIAGADPQQQQLAARLATALAPFVRRLHLAGVRILVGSDSPLAGNAPWGSAYHAELRALASAGIPTATLLRLAGEDGARYLAGRSTAIAAGNDADLVLLSANPLDAVTNFERVAHVVVGGRLATR